MGRLAARGSVSSSARPGGPRRPVRPRLAAAGSYALPLLWDARGARRVLPAAAMALDDGGDVLGADAMKAQVKAAGKFPAVCGG